MNNEFLSRFREAPRPEFAERLYRRIAPKEDSKMQNLSRPRLSSLRRLGMGAVVLCVVVAGILVASPTARAQVAAFVGRIFTVGGVNFEITDIDRDSGGTPVSDSYRATLEEAQELLPGPLLVPGWVPAGFSLSNVVVDLPKDVPEDIQLPFLATVVLTWKKDADDGPIFIEVLYPRTPDQWGEGWWLVHPEGSVEELQVGGEPAALAREGSWWNFETGQWVNAQAFRLFVKRPDGVLYKFATPESVASVDDLMHMAESLQPYP